MREVDRHTLPARIRNRTATQDEIDWAKRRCELLEEDRPIFGLTPGEAEELDALRDALTEVGA